MMGTEGVGNDIRSTRTRERRRKHQKQAPRRQREHHELGLAHHRSRRHGTHSVRGMPINKLTTHPAARGFAGGRDGGGPRGPGARRRASSRRSSRRRRRKPFRTLAMTACVRRFGMRNLREEATRGRRDL